jgi:hypothetical protein
LRSTRDELSGYEGASQCGSATAFAQRQNDVLGAVLDSILFHTRRSQRLPRRLWPIVESQAECAVRLWREPDQGIWEARGDPRHFVSSKVMCWVALDRAAKLADIRGDSELRASWQSTADEIRADILKHGVSDRGVLRQHYETDALDASNLLAALFGFLPGNDERLKCHRSVSTPRSSTPTRGACSETSLGVLTSGVPRSGRGSSSPSGFRSTPCSEEMLPLLGS